MSRFLVPPQPAEVKPLPGPPTFSIVITAYQAADTIVAAIDSALAQTHPAHEVIVVDDGSTDDLAGALRPYGDRIATIRRENGGGAAARNTGAEAASADFMAVLDADDAYHPRRLEAIAGLAQARPDLDLITTDARFVVDGQGAGTFLEHNPFPTSSQRTAIFASCFVGGWPAVRIASLRAVGGYDERMRIAYDWDCWLRMILAGSRAGIVDEPYYDYVLHGGSLASSRVASLRERVVLLEKAGGNPLLRADERPLLDAALRQHRTEAARAAIESVLDGNGPRGVLPRLVLSRGVRWRARVLAALAVVAPPLARRLIHPVPLPEQRFGENAA